MRILLVEDEPDAARLLAKGLREQRYAVDVALDGEAAVFQAGVNDYDLLILDVQLPLKNGFEVCREVRANGGQMPILLLTARDAVQDRIAGLDYGADDYLTKPYDFHELLARVRALLRRKQTSLRSDILQIADLTLNTANHTATRNGHSIPLTAKEYALLEFFVLEVTARSAANILGIQPNSAALFPNRQPVLGHLYAP